MLTREEELELEELEFVIIPTPDMNFEDKVIASKKVRRKCELLAKRDCITEEQAFDLLKEYQNIAEGYGDYLLKQRAEGKI